MKSTYSVWSMKLSRFLSVTAKKVMHVKKSEEDNDGGGVGSTAFGEFVGDMVGISVFVSFQTFVALYDSSQKAASALSCSTDAGCPDRAPTVDMVPAESPAAVTKTSRKSNGSSRYDCLRNALTVKRLTKITNSF